MAKLKTLTIDGVSQDVPVIEVGDYLKYDETLGKIEQVPVHSITSGVDTTSVPSGSSGKKIDTYTIPCDGIAIVRGYATFPANTTGYRYFSAGISRGGNWVTRAIQRVSPCSSGSTILTATELMPVSKNDTVTLGFIQSSGSAMTVEYSRSVVIFPKTYE